MKLYTFTDENDDIIEQVRAENHDCAVKLVSNNSINWHTDFYSESIE